MAPYLQHIPDKLQILIQSPATWKEEPLLPPHPHPPQSHLDQTGPPSSLRPPGVGLQRSAARWAEGEGEGEGVRADGEMNVRLSETVNVAAVAGQGRSEALECCSEQRTPGGGTTPTSPWRHLKDKIGEMGGLSHLIHFNSFQ